MTHPPQGTKAEALAISLYGPGTHLRWRAVGGGSQWWIESPALKVGAIAARTLDLLEEKLTAITRACILSSRQEVPVEATQSQHSNLVTAKQAAEILGSSDAYIYLLKKQGHLTVKASIPGRGGKDGSRHLYDPADVRAYLQSHGPVRNRARGLKRDQIHRAKHGSNGSTASAARDPRVPIRGKVNTVLLDKAGLRTRVARLVETYNRSTPFEVTAMDVMEKALRLGLEVLEKRK